MPVAITSPGSSVKASERWETCWKQSKTISAVLASWRSSSSTKQRIAQVLRVADLIGRDQPGSERPVGVEGLADRHRLRPALPVAHAEVVGAGVAGDHLVGALDRDVAAALADHDRQLGLVVEQGRDLRHVHVGARPDHAGHLLVEEDRHFGRLHPHLGDVVGVVERDAEVLARSGRREQPDLGERQARRVGGELLEAVAADLGKRRRGFGGDVGSREVDQLVALDDAQRGRTSGTGEAGESHRAGTLPQKRR